MNTLFFKKTLDDDASYTEIEIEDLPTIKFKSFELFDDSGIYLDNNKLFFAYYGKVPNIKEIEDVDCSKLHLLLQTKYATEIQQKHYKQVYCGAQKRMKHADIIFIMKDGTLLDVCHRRFCVLFTQNNEEVAQEWINRAKPYIKKQSTKNQICLVTTGQEGLRRTSIKFKKPKLNINMNYNEDIVDIHKKIVAKLKVKNGSGLFLFHGLPGTGKSTYIKYLIHYLNKDVIFMSPRLAGSLDAPDLTSFLIKNKNTVIVIEDAEELITAREGGRNSTISTLLNLTDGLLGECLGIQIIATFNTHVANIDSALLRKGRLQALYEFKELNIAKSKALLQAIGIHHYNVEKPMTLADIYNLKETDFQTQKERAPIGFIQNRA